MQASTRTNRSTDTMVADIRHRPPQLRDDGVTETKMTTPPNADPPPQYEMGAQRQQQTTVDIGLGMEQMGSVPKETDFTFLNFESQGTGYDVSGTMETLASPGGTSGGGVRYRRISDGGAAAKFLDNRGFGWLLEVEDDNEDEDADRPLLEELDIDLKDIYYKIRCVLLPLPYFRLKLALVRDSPDFWGPLIVVLTYALLSIYGQLGVVSWILTIWFCGSFIIFFLARVLGGEVGYSQCLGIIGYCLIPLVVTCLISPLAARWHYVNLLIKLFGVTWAVYSSGTLLCVEELQSKRPLVLYPVFLLYVYFLSLYTGV